LEQRLYLWTNQRGPLSEERIRDSIKASFAKYLRVNLTISMYRHVAIAFMEKHLRGYLIDIAFHLQAGHSFETAKVHYANSNLDLRHVDRANMEAFSRVSYQWQQLLLIQPKEEFDTSPHSLLLKMERLEKSTFILD
jgi:hypothetical protein